MSITKAQRLRAQLGAHTLHGNTAQADEVHRELRVTVAEEHIKRLVASWPPLTAEQRTRLAALLLSAPATPDEAA